MKKTIITLLTIAAFALTGCKDKPKTEVPQPPAGMPAGMSSGMPAGMPAQGQMPPGHPNVTPGENPHAGMKAQEIPAGVGKKAKVTQTMNASSYTYVEATDEKGQKVWLALPEVKVKVGDTIEYPEAPTIPNFKSKTLNKTFDKISFIPGIRIVK